MAGALAQLSAEDETDPDAQATISDFIDYTEFFPSDLFRSLSLIGKLDETYHNDANRVHELAKTWASLPSLAEDERPDTLQIRRDISLALDHALRCRESTYAEASRLCKVADVLYDRLVGIQSKLVAMPMPPSREISPVTSRSQRVAKSPVRQRRDVDRSTKTTFAVNDPHSHKARRSFHGQPKQRTQPGRVIVPGEVLPPHELNDFTASSSSESERERSPVRPLQKIRLQPKTPKLNMNQNELHEPIGTPKQRNTPIALAAGLVGTNIHSTVAGISVSNAMASLTPPPENPPLGSEWAPWLELTDWELHVLRRRMKKNANWVPSEVMRERALAERGRGTEKYNHAKAAAKANGKSLLDEPRHVSLTTRDSNKHTTEADEADNAPAEESRTFKEVKRSHKKKIKPNHASASAKVEDADERQRRELEESMARITQIGTDMEKLYNSPGTPSRTNSRKRNVENTLGNDRLQLSAGVKTDTTNLTTRIKLSNPDGQKASGAHGRTSTRLTNVTSGTKGPNMKDSHPKSENSITLRLHQLSPNVADPSVSSRSRRKYELTNRRSDSKSLVLQNHDSMLKNRAVSASAANIKNERRSHPNETTKSSTHSKRKSADAMLIDDALNAVGVTRAARRAVSLATLEPDDTPSPKRRKGLSAAEQSKSAAANTKANAAQDKDEEHYCLCQDVQHGTMVACEREGAGCTGYGWYHLACLGMGEDQVPKETQRWFCPWCRESMGVDENGRRIGARRSGRH